MRTLTLQQGSPDWLAHRRTTRNASDAPAMMGASPYVTRADLVRQRATGIEREIDESTQRRFDRGHEVEPALRAMAEELLDEDLFPVTGVADDGYLGASFDGVTLAEDVIFEAKQSNATKQEQILLGQIPPVDYWQIVQQFAVCTGARECLYLCGDGTVESTSHLWIKREQVDADIPKLLAGWAQFDADVAAYAPEAEVLPAAAGRAPEQLPALRVDVQGMVTFSNLEDFRSSAMAVLGSINRDLQTDADFADAEQTVKWAKGVEERLEGAKAQALSQTADIEAVFRTIDDVSAETRRVRLDLDKLVKQRKEAIKGEVVAAGAAAVRAHYDTINATLGQHAFQPAQTLQLNLGSAIKGMRSIKAMRDAVDAAVAVVKIEASQQAERVRANLAILAEHADHASLFADRVQLCAAKHPDDLRNLARARIAEHEQREADRLERERERIRQEEADRLRREAAAAPPAVGSAPQDPPGHDARAAAEPTPQAGAPASAPLTISGAAPTPAGARVKLGDLNAWIAPLTISAAGLAALGFKPASTRGAAQLYAAADLPRICAALQDVIRRAPQRATEKDAA